MRVGELERYLHQLFVTSDKDNFSDESGFTITGRPLIERIGYCTNLTLETVGAAIAEGVDLMLTHHDAWDFVYGLKEACHARLKQHGMAHYFTHLPLDDADFGTNAQVLTGLGLNCTEKTHYHEGYSCGRIGVYDIPVSFEEFLKTSERVLGEHVQYWQNHSREIKKVAVASGGGGMTSDLQEAVEKGCDLYLTGEKSLYTLEYAQFAKICLVVGSHTNTEVLGVAALADQVAGQFPDVTVTRLGESNIEEAGFAYLARIE